MTQDRTVVITLQPTRVPSKINFGDPTKRKMIFGKDGIVVVSYYPQSEAYFAAMPTQLSDTNKVIVDNRIRSLVDNGIWNKLDVLYFLDMHTPEASLINVVNPGTFDANNNLCTHTAYTGFKGDTGKYIDTTFNPSSSVYTGRHYTKDTASMFGYAT